MGLKSGGAKPLERAQIDDYSLNNKTHVTNN